MLQLVKEHFNDHPELTAAVPADQVDNVHKEIAATLTDHVQGQPAFSGGMGGLLGQLEGGLTSGSMLSNAITGGLVGSLASKFGLPPLVTGAIAASAPALLQKFLHRNGVN